METARCSKCSGDNVWKKFVFGLRDFVLEMELFFLEPFKLKLVRMQAGLKADDRGIEIAMFLLQACKSRAKPLALRILALILAGPVVIRRTVANMVPLAGHFRAVGFFYGHP